MSVELDLFSFPSRFRKIESTAATAADECVDGS